MVLVETRNDDLVHRATTGRTPARHVRSRESDGTRRTDLDGLRAVAVLLVVVYHVWADRVSGGVDVFLMLSAFFLTGSFLRAMTRGRPLALGAYWARTFTRLVPTSAVVLLAVLVTAHAVYPASRWPAIWSQSWASLAYVQNWQLAREAVDYYARDAATLSPLQHYWSLSVQGQVFVLWPVLLAACAVVVRHLHLRAETVLLVVFGVVFVASLAFSVVETTTDQDVAYFDTRARLWEFALGSLVAVVLPRVRPPRWAARVLGWGGLAAIAACGLVLDARGGFPGYLALWPTAGAAAVILAGSAGAGTGAGRLLSHPALVRLGGDAYALYLVHWPLLVTWRLLDGGRPPSFAGGAVVVVASVLLARVLTAAVERPLREATWVHRGSVRRGVVVAVALALVAVPLAGWQGVERRRAAELTAHTPVDNPGAAVLLPGYRAQGDPHAPARPLATTLDEQWVVLPEPCSDALVAGATAEVAERCHELAPTSASAPTVVVLGDSHSEQFMGALLPIAERDGWRLVSLLKGGCSFGLGEHPCAAWNEEALRFVVGLQPDAVLTVVTAAERDGTGEVPVTGQQEAVDALAASGIDLIGVRDNPRFSFDMFACAEAHGPEAEECRRELATVSARRDPASDLDLTDSSVLVDLSAETCPAGVCAPVVGNVHVFLDDNHLTWDYARTLAPFLEERLAPWRDGLALEP